MTWHSLLLCFSSIAVLSPGVVAVYTCAQANFGILKLFVYPKYWNLQKAGRSWSCPD